MKALSERMHGTAKNANEGVLSLNENILAAYADEVAQLEEHRDQLLIDSWEIAQENATLKRENEALREKARTEMFRAIGAEANLDKPPQERVYCVGCTLPSDNAILKREIVNAIAIMDEKGCKNPEGNSTMLWNKDWEQLRFILFALLTAEEPE